MKEEVTTDTPQAKKAWFEQLPIRFEKKFWNSEKIISLSAFVVSIATLLALMYQIRLSDEQNELAREQQYASVLPYLEIWLRINSEGTKFALELANNGVGPAFIEEIRVVYNDQVYPGDPAHFYDQEIIKTDSIDFGYANINKGRLIPAGESIDMLFVVSSDEDRDKLIHWFARNETGGELARVEVVYASVYGERWVTRGLAAIPEALPDETKE